MGGQGSGGDGWPRFRKMGGQGSGGGGWPRSGRWVAKAQGADGQGFRAMAKVPESEWPLSIPKALVTSIC